MECNRIRAEHGGVRWQDGENFRVRKDLVNAKPVVIDYNHGKDRHYGPESQPNNSHIAEDSAPWDRRGKWHNRRWKAGDDQAGPRNQSYYHDTRQRRPHRCAKENIPAKTTSRDDDWRSHNRRETMLKPKPLIEDITPTAKSPSRAYLEVTGQSNHFLCLGGNNINSM